MFLQYFFVLLITNITPISPTASFGEFIRLDFCVSFIVEFEFNFLSFHHVDTLEKLLWIFITLKTVNSVLMIHLFQSCRN